MGFHCSDFHETPHPSINFREHFLNLRLYNSVKKCRRRRHNLIYAPQCEIPCTYFHKNRQDGTSLRGDILY
jgi:hypothetical protein